jgi:hypothetical protein
LFPDHYLETTQLVIDLIYSNCNYQYEGSKSTTRTYVVLAATVRLIRSNSYNIVSR